MMRSAVTGVVRDRSGQPQVGALVELLNTQYVVVAKTFTDDRGHYALARLGAGVYQVKASTSLSLPTIHPDLKLVEHSRIIVDLTLSTLYQALQWLPAEPRKPDSATDDWNWTLRLAANRPLLRMMDPAQTLTVASGQLQPGMDVAGGPVMVETGTRAGSARAARQVSIHSGLTRFGQGGLQQQVAWAPQGGETRSILFIAETATEPGSLGRVSTTAAYRQELSPDRSVATIVSFTDRPGIESSTGSGLATMHVRSASKVEMGDMATISAGTDLEADRFGAGQLAMEGMPFLKLQVHAGQTEVQYNVATAPGLRDADDLEARTSDDEPAVSMVDGTLQRERGLHQELSVSHKLGTMTGELHVFHDTLEHPVLEGALSGDEAAIDTENVLYDPGTGTIAVSGHGYSGGGVMAMLHDQLNADTWLTLRYAMGEAISTPEIAAHANDLAGEAQASSAHETAMASIAAGTRFASTGTTVRGSYRWQPVSALTQVAPFDSDVPDAYLSFTLRQPLHLQMIGSGKLAAIVDVRNLLAQGYRPFLSQDGSTVFFAQSQRCLAAGVTFSF